MPTVLKIEILRSLKLHDTSDPISLFVEVPAVRTVSDLGVGAGLKQGLKAAGLLGDTVSRDPFESLTIIASKVIRIPFEQHRQSNAFVGDVNLETVLEKRTGGKIQLVFKFAIFKRVDSDGRTAFGSTIESEVNTWITGQSIFESGVILLERQSGEWDRGSSVAS